MAIAKSFKKQDDWTAALHHYRQAAAKGSPAAQSWIAHCYLHGKGVQKDVNAGVEMLKLAADKGHSMAQVKLGACAHSSFFFYLCSY